MNAGRRVGLYFGLLAVTGGLADPMGGLADLPLLFILKDQLHLGPQFVALFGAITVIPRHAGFLFGLGRDRWRPAGLGDRGYFLLAAVVATGCYLWLAVVGLNVWTLLGTIFVIAVAFQIFDTSAQALLTIVAQRHLMTGRLSALMEIADNAVSALAILAGGWLVTHASHPTIFLLAAAVAALIFIQGLWDPPEIFSNVEASDGAHLGLRSIRAILVYPAFWPTLAMLVLYNFSPGWGTPFFYYLTTRLNLSSEAFGVCRSVTYAAVAVATIAYGFLCYRKPLRHLLWWAIALNLFPGFLFLLIGNTWQAIVVSAIGGLTTGFGNIAVFDLVMRACPKKMEGTASMLAFSIFGLAGTLGDVLGAAIYQSTGFALCIVIDAVATALMIPFLLRLPSTVISYRDGEARAAEPLEAQ